MINVLLHIVLVLLVAGFLVWLIRQMSFITEPFNRVIIGIICFATFIYVLMTLFGMLDTRL